MRNVHNSFVQRKGTLQQMEAGNLEISEFIGIWIAQLHDCLRNVRNCAIQLKYLNKREITGQGMSSLNI